MKAILFKLFAATCNDGGFLGLPPWHRGLGRDSDCGVQLAGLSDIWKVVANLVDIALRLAGVVAVLFIIWGGIQFVISRGEPDQLANARNIIVNAIAGLIIAILATTIVSFIAGRF